jgi:hypothetical protein
MRLSWTVLYPPVSVTFSVSALCPHRGQNALLKPRLAPQVDLPNLRTLWGIII